MINYKFLTFLWKNFLHANISVLYKNIWIVRGHYLNIGAGGEIGLYERASNIPIINVEQWEQSDIRMPMTLYLYNKKDKSNIFSWAPTEKQWWITGFNPTIYDLNVKDMVMVGSMDFSGHKDEYDELKKAVINKPEKSKYMYFNDTTHTVWILWEN